MTASHKAKSESEALEQAGTKREALEIIIGGGSYTPVPSPQCPSPPPAPCPPPPPPPPLQQLTRLEKARLVLLNFKKIDR
ncbi:unnamed protein product [Lupinus luteus]|uniref:Uncharacterized protein n=1 Tax=Lupinus luteus TaxID=3873 RepID=A0AAV1YE58_LUPLU